MEIILKKQFIKEVSRLPIKIQTSVREILDKIEKAETFKNIDIDIKRMEGQKADENYYRVRVGQYRIGIEVIDPKVIIITILSRGDVYKKFPPS
jgi:mRNA interferase RelE/StbE